MKPILYDGCEVKITGYWESGAVKAQARTWEDKTGDSSSTTTGTMTGPRVETRLRRVKIDSHMKKDDEDRRRRTKT